MQDYQSLNRQLEAVEANIPTAGLVEETEERLLDRISLYQVHCDISKFPNGPPCLITNINTKHMEYAKIISATLNNARSFSWENAVSLGCSSS